MYTEPTLNKEIIFEGKIITVEHHEVKSGDKTAQREIVRHVPGVCILARNEDNKIFFVSQYRKPFEKEILELPAGKVDKGEDNLQCAKRELREETGYSAADWKLLGKYYASPGFTDETVFIYEAWNLKWDPLKGDEDEHLKVFEYSEDEIKSLVKTGRLSDGKSLAALFLRSV